MKSEREDTNSDPDKLDIYIFKQKPSEIFYKNSSRVDNHNIDRQENMKMETKVEIKYWPMRINMSLV